MKYIGIVMCFMEMSVKAMDKIRSLAIVGRCGRADAQRENWKPANKLIQGRSRDTKDFQTGMSG